MYLPSRRLLCRTLYNTLQQNTEVEVEKYRQRIEQWSKTNGGASSHRNAGLESSLASVLS